MSVETRYVDAWLDTTLRNDPVLSSLINGRVYNTLAPTDAPLPYVVWSYQGGSDVAAIGTQRVFVRCVYQVRAVGTGSSYVPLRNIADRVDVVLHGATGSVPGGRILSVAREQVVQLLEVIDGIMVRYLGGLYRVLVQES